MNATELLKALRKRTGLSRRAFAKAINLAPSTYQHYETGYKKSRYDAEFVRRVTPVLLENGVPLEEIAQLSQLNLSGQAIDSPYQSVQATQHNSHMGHLAEGPAQNQSLDPILSKSRSVNEPPVGNPGGAMTANAVYAGPAPNFMEFARDLPIRGTAAGSFSDEGAIHFDHDAQFGFLRRPPGLTGVKEAYAIFVVGDSMFPRYSAGNAVLVNPHRPPHTGDDVVIQIQRGPDAPIEAFIKTYKFRSTKELICEQYNPVKEITFSASDIIAVHRICPSAELLDL